LPENSPAPQNIPLTENQPASLSEPLEEMEPVVSPKEEPASAPVKAAQTALVTFYSGAWLWLLFLLAWWLREKVKRRRQRRREIWLQAFKK
jgi:hypothetical protein